LLKEVLNHLEDSHSYLIDTSGNQVSLYYSPRFIKDSALFKEAAIDSYFDKKLLEIENTFRYGITPDIIGYVHIKQFPSDLNIFARFDGILQEFKDCSGLIIDVRHNFGGSSDAVYSIVSQIISDTIQGVKWTGMRGEIVPIVEYSPSPKFCFTKPIIVLINGLSYSASENFANLCKKVVHVTLLGDTTGGGGGVPGTFQLPSGLSFSLSTKEMYRYDGNHVEVNGIDPDILIQNSVEELQINMDKQLGKAIEVIKIRSTTSGHY
jgi:C-terminal processing protease CtpA/Prc